MTGDYALREMRMLTASAIEATLIVPFFVMRLEMLEPMLDRLAVAPPVDPHRGRGWLRWMVSAVAVE